MGAMMTLEVAAQAAVYRRMPLASAASPIYVTTVNAPEAFERSFPFDVIRTCTVYHPWQIGPANWTADMSYPDPSFGRRVIGMGQ